MVAFLCTFSITFGHNIRWMSDYSENRDVSDCQITVKTEMCQTVRMSDYNENRDVSNCHDVRLQ